MNQTALDPLIPNVSASLPRYDCTAIKSSRMRRIAACGSLCVTCWLLLLRFGWLQGVARGLDKRQVRFVILLEIIFDGEQFFLAAGLP